MITLHDLLTNLTYGEFSQLHLGNFLIDEHENAPDPKSYAQLTSHINLGLSAIYAEFMLASEELYVQLHEEIETYTLSYQYAVSNTAGTEPIKYINDTVAKPFKDNVLKIEEVYDEAGNLLFTNDSTEELALNTPTYRSIQVPWPNDYNVLAVQYRAGHGKVVVTSQTDLTAVEIAVPIQLEEALMFYVASRVFAALPQATESSDANDYFRKYQSKIGEVRHQGLYVQPTEAGGKTQFEANGWV
jgi:hypothetical protein